ncbi:ABC transporter substrate-binding protein [Longibaculum muris]|uniref:ABC transporter substrate-binding protein n=1 Tax=Longibaculum muris TaxID=1796628 RepID=UPI0022E48E3D|nr:extracellular solute-binding protein [Longibaculum muris]
MRGKNLLKLMVCSLLIAGCQSSKPEIVQKKQNNDAISINFLTGSLQKDVIDYFEEIMKSFHEENPTIDVAYEGYQQLENTNKTLADLIGERLKNNEATDVACMDVKNIFDFVNQDKLVDLSDVPFTDKLIDIAKKDSTVNGKIYSVPAALVAYCMTVNMDMLKTCGLTKPTNWDEFLHCCEVLKKKGYQPIVGTQKFMKLIIYAGGLSQIYFNDRSEEYIKKLNSGEMKISEFARPGFEMLKTLIDKGYLDAKEALKYKPKDIVKIYNQKKSCFAFTYSSMISPDRIDFSFEFTGIPMKKGNVLLIASDRRMSVFTKSQHVEECKKFVDYFSNEDVQKKTLETFGKLPAYNNINVTLDKEMSDLQDVISKGNTMLLQDYNLKFEQWANLDDLCDGLLAGKTVQQQLDAFDAIQAEAIK